jgi:hypothetical protein
VSCSSSWYLYLISLIFKASGFTLSLVKSTTNPSSLAALNWFFSLWFPSRWNITLELQKGRDEQAPARNKELLSVGVVSTVPFFDFWLEFYYYSLLNDALAYCLCAEGILFSPIHLSLSETIPYCPKLFPVASSGLLAKKVRSSYQVLI